MYFLPQGCTSQRFHNPLTNSNTNRRTSVQICEPMGGISRSNTAPDMGDDFPRPAWMESPSLSARGLHTLQTTGHWDGIAHSWGGVGWDLRRGSRPPPLDPSETEQPQARFEGPLWMVTAALVKMAVAARCVWCQTIPDWVLVSETWPNLSSPRPRLHLVQWEHGRADLLTGGMGTRGAENSVWHMVTLGPLM